MKLVRYQYKNRDFFGFTVDDYVVPFTDGGLLGSVETYLKNLPDSRILAEKIVNGFKADGDTLKEDDVKYLPIIPTPSALIDFGLTPKHMYQSAAGFVNYEYSGLKRIIARKVIRKKVDKAMSNPNYPYYRGNNSAVSGEGDTVVWPSYCEYLDIEPELAFVYGNDKEKIAGYFILNDLSARDVQIPELDSLSLTRSKDFDNGISSCLVTPDEVGDPRDLKVSVNIGNREKWEGDSSDYMISPEETLSYLETLFIPASGTVVGMGTIPGCCCIENDSWMRPGDKISIEFEKLGKLVQYIPENVSVPKKGRWKKREDI